MSKFLIRELYSDCIEENHFFPLSSFIVMVNERGSSHVPVDRSAMAVDANAIHHCPWDDFNRELRRGSEELCTNEFGTRLVLQVCI